MKYLTCILFAIIFPVSAFPQYHDKIWTLGYAHNDSGSINGLRLVFGDSLSIQMMPQTMSIDLTNASIADSMGNLQAYTNGCYFDNKFGNYIDGSWPLNPGITFDIFCSNSGYNSSLSALILPRPEHPNLITYIHSPIVETPSWIFAQNLVHTDIDLSAYGGIGNTIALHQEIFIDTIGYDGIHAVKHANGRDFWVVSTKENSNLYHFSLFSPQGIQLHHTQSIGDIINVNGGGNIVFSPDGTKMARYNPQNDLRVFDFDRCTGTLSNPQNIYWSDASDVEIYGGVAFSADSRYLYVSSGFLVYQFDTYEPNIESTRALVGEWDGSNCPFTCNFGKMELAPDGTILITPSSGSTNVFHRIRNPEKESSYCNFINRDISISPTFDFASMPHFAVFRLGPIDGSPCDTLGLDNHPLANWRHWANNLTVDFATLSTYEPTYWHWTFGDGAESTERFPVHVYAQPGVYTVCHDVGNAYSADTLCKQITVGGVFTQAPGDDAFQVFPNPVVDQIYIHRPAYDATALTYQLFDAYGHRVQSGALDGSALEVSRLPAGPYLLVVFSEGIRRGVARFVKI